MQTNSNSLFNNNQNTNKDSQNNISAFNNIKFGANINSDNNQPASTNENKETSNNTGFSLFNNEQKENNKNSLFGIKKEKEQEVKNSIFDKDNKPEKNIQIQNQEQKKDNEAKALNVFNNNEKKNDDEKNNRNLFNVLSQPNNVNENKANNNQDNNINEINNNANNNNDNNNANNNIVNNNENEEYKIINNIPENSFHFSDCKELNDYEKDQILHQTNSEIIEDFKNMLNSQKIKFKECTKNTRILESKYYELIKINLDNNKFCQINEKRGNNIIAKLTSMNERYKNMQKAIEFIDNKMTGILKPYKDNIMNSDIFLSNQNNSEKFKFYEDFMKVSKKCFTIENNLNEAENALSKKEKEIADRSNSIENNNGNLGMWVERPNNKKIFVSQNEMNTMLTECYDGLMNLKNMQDSIDNKYELLKKSLLKGMRNNNNEIDY